MSNRPRSIIMCSSNGEELKIFATAKDAAEYLGKTWPNPIYRSINYGTLAFGYRYKYQGEELKIAKEGTPGKRRAIIAIDIKHNKEFEFISISECSRQMHISITAIESALHYGHKVKGHHFKYKDEELVPQSQKNARKRHVLLLDDEGNIVKEYSSVHELAAAYGVTIGAIYQYVNPKILPKRFRGYFVRYKE